MEIVIRDVQGFRVMEGLSCVFSMVKQQGKARNLALPSLKNPVFSSALQAFSLQTDGNMGSSILSLLLVGEDAWLPG